MVVWRAAYGRNSLPTVVPGRGRHTCLVHGARGGRVRVFTVVQRVRCLLSRDAEVSVLHAARTMRFGRGKKRKERPLGAWRACAQDTPTRVLRACSDGRRAYCVTPYQSWSHWRIWPISCSCAVIILPASCLISACSACCCAWRAISIAPS